MTKRWLVAMLPLLAGCRGDLLASAKLPGPGTAQTRFDSGKDVELWSAFDGQWEGNASSKYSKPPLAYQIEVLQGGDVVGKVTCVTATSSSRVCGEFKKVGGEFEGDCEFRMNCELPKLRPGEVVLRVTGKLADPARVKQVKDMSLNVRAK